MKIAYSPYRLRFRNRIGGERDGVLLQIENQNGIGYADLHPWPELGDLPLASQLQLLKDGQSTPLIERALALAQEDRDARILGKNLFEGLEVPPSHFLIVDLQATGADRLTALEDSSFRAVKFKLGRDLKNELEVLERLTLVAPETLRFRLDFNAHPSAAELAAALTSMSPALKERIEFIEDPSPFHAEHWLQLSRQSGIGFALDRDSTDLEKVRAGAHAQAFTHLVLKPAVQNEELVFKALSPDVIARLKLVVTSYLGHPLGLAAAAYCAGKLNDNKHRDQGVAIVEAGLLSHVVYEVSEYSECIQHDGPFWRGVEGTGLGFDSLLRRETWRAL